MASKPKTPAKKATPPKKPATKAKAPKGLNYQQRLFALEYLKDRNGTQAAIRAGYSAHTAGSQAERLLRKVEIKALIEAVVIKAEEKVGLTVERTLLELARMAFFDPRKLFREDGSPKPITELDDDTAAALAGLDVHEEYTGQGEDKVFVGYTKKYKLVDKNAAIDKAMKHFGQYKRDNEQTMNPMLEFLKGLSGNSALPIVKG